jgi:hypothetical protein
LFSWAFKVRISGKENKKIRIRFIRVVFLKKKAGAICYESARNIK